MNMLIFGHVEVQDLVRGASEAVGIAEGVLELKSLGGRVDDDKLGK